MNLRLKARPQRVDEELHLRIRARCASSFDEIGGVVLREHARCQNLGVQFRAQFLVRFFRLERRALPVLRERLEDGCGVVGEVHDHDVLLALVAAVQARDRLHGVAVHHRLVEEHAGEQRLIEAGLEFVRHDHEPVVVALEAIFDQLAVLATRSRRAR